MDEAIICHIIRRNALLRHSMEQIACLAYLAFLKEAVDDRGICHHVGGAAQLRHPVKQHVESLISPLCAAEALEKSANLNDACLKSRPEETAEESEHQIEAVCAAAAVHEDAVGAGRWLCHTSAGTLGYAAEEGDRECRAVSAGRGRQSTGEGGEKFVQGAVLDRIALPEQFVEQVVCVLRGEDARARTLRGGGEGGVGIPAA